MRELRLYYADSGPLTGEYEGNAVAVDTHAWRYDDPEHDRLGEPFVMGASEMIDVLRRLHGLPVDREPFTLVFSDEPFDGAERIDYLGRTTLTMSGSWYEWGVQRFWLCPALLDFFEKPPANIWVKAVAIVGELCTSCMKPVEPGQEWCKTPQCGTDLRDSNNRIPASWIGQ